MKIFNRIFGLLINKRAIRFASSFFLIYLVLFIVSCKQNYRFTSRKYTKGHYFEGLTKKEKTDRKKNHFDNVLKEDLSASIKEEVVVENKSNEKIEDDLTISKNEIAVKKGSVTKQLRNSPVVVTKFHAARQLNKAIDKINDLKQIAVQKNNNSFQALPFVAFIFACLAISTPPVCLILIIIYGRFAPVIPVIIVGLVFAFSAIALGIIGLIKTYDGTASGNQALSSIGIIMGAVAIVLCLLMLIFFLLMVL